MSVIPMVTARVSSKGQITIPSAVRKALGLAQGDEVILIVDGEEARLKVMKRHRLTELYGALPAKTPHPDFGAVRRQAQQSRGQLYRQRGES